MRHFIDINDADALQRLLDFRPNHPYFRRKTTSLLQGEPASLRMRVTKEEEERFFPAGDLGSSYGWVTDAMGAAFRHRDMSCLQQLIDHGLADYSWLLDKAVNDAVYMSAPPLPGHGAVFEWLLSYPPRHVMQAMLLMWGRPSLHPSWQPLCGWQSPIGKSGDSMLYVAAGRGHPASQQTLNELRMMLAILTDDNSGGIIPEARQPLSNALHIAREKAAMWPHMRPLVANYLQRVCTWENYPSSRS